MQEKKILIASDHGGFLLKESLKSYLHQKGYEVVDYGTNSTDSVNYPDYAKLLAHGIKDQTAEKGILIWQDLMFACGYYNMENELFVTEIKAEIIDNLKRIHNHASLMLICGNNENETAALNWGIPSPEYTKKWYLYQYEELIPSLVNSVAPDIFYWPSSPSSGGGFDDPNSDSRGDVHYWDVWHGNKPIEAYRTIYPRMLSEFGMQSFPCMKTINSFTFKVIIEMHVSIVNIN